MRPSSPVACLYMALPIGISLLASVVIASSPARATELTVLIDNLRSAQGTLMLALFDSEAAFGKQSEAIDSQRIAVERSPTSATFRNVPPGRYAIQVYHDENGNGVLDKNMLGMPTERYGFSNDAVGRFAAPAFDQAAFEVTADATVKINLR